MTPDQFLASVEKHAGSGPLQRVAEERRENCSASACAAIANVLDKQMSPEREGHGR